MKIKLDADFNTPATVFGIISDLPDYRLCYVLNKELRLRLCRYKNDKELVLKNKGRLCFSEFYYHDVAAMLEWRLTSNKYALIYPNDNTEPQITAIPLVADLKTMNYFLWYADDPIPEINRDLTSRLQKNRYIRTVQQIEVEASKNIDNLLVEF